MLPCAGPSGVPQALRLPGQLLMVRWWCCCFWQVGVGLATGRGRWAEAGRAHKSSSRLWGAHGGSETRPRAVAAGRVTVTGLHATQRGGVRERKRSCFIYPRPFLHQRWRRACRPSASMQSCPMRMPRPRDPPSGARPHDCNKPSAHTFSRTAEAPGWRVSCR